VGRGRCVPAKIIAILGHATLLAKLTGPGTAFRPTYPTSYRAHGDKNVGFAGYRWLTEERTLQTVWSRAGKKT